MQSVATRTRTNQITILVAISFLFYEMTNWQQGIWVVISTVVVAGPFSTFLSFEKAKNRFLGTLVGLFIAAGIEYYLRFNPDQLPVVAVIIAFFIGFLATKSYRYFIVLITTCTCLGYTYMNMPYTSFAPMSFVIDRAMGVFVGILIFFLMQHFVFGNHNSKLELLEESVDTLTKLEKTLVTYKTSPTLTTAYECAADIYTNTRSLQNYLGTSNLIFGAQNYSELRFAKQVLMLNDRATRLLIDEPTVVMRQIEQLHQVVTLKLAR
jgi:uncharacterized membrane protein YgaE (UPF0421/DUF939 family)